MLVLLLFLLLMLILALRRQETFTTEGNAMVIVEPRPHAHLKRVLENFDDHMPASYVMYVFHGLSHSAFAQEATANVRRRCIRISLEQDNLTAEQYNALLKTRDFWDRVHAENILVFQTDTVLCGAADMSRFERFDYIGCPFSDGGTGKHPVWGNEPFYGIGGLSFRKKSAMLACIDRAGHSDNSAEDVFFSNCQHANEPRPTSHDLQAFCTQHKFVGPSLGGHQIRNLPAEDKRDFLRYCPASMFMADR